MHGVSIELTTQEIIMAAQAAPIRVANQLYQLRADGHASNRGRGDVDAYSQVITHMQAAAAEIAVARFLGIPWPGSFGDAGPDLVRHDRDGRPVYIDVKHTRHENGRLIVDPDRGHANWQYILVTGYPPHLTIVGWRWGLDIMQPQHLRALTPHRPESYCMEQSQLNPMRPAA